MRERLRREHVKPQDSRFDLKQGAGGMVDIEFLVQYLVLLNAHAHPELIRWTDNVRLLEGLAKVGVLDEAAADFLTQTYLTYRQAAHRLSLEEKEPKVSVGRYDDRRKRVADLWRQFFEQASGAA